MNCQGALRLKLFPLLFCFLAAVPDGGWAQTGSRSTRAEELRQTLSPPKPQTADGSPARAGGDFMLEDGTVVKLKLLRDLLSSKVEDEDTIDFEVIEDVKVDGVVVIPRGAKAEGTVIDAQTARRMGRTGRIGVRFDWVFPASGKRLPLRAVSARSDGSRAAEVASNALLAGAFFFPAAPVFLLMKGKEVVIPKGTLATSFIDGDQRLDRDAFVSAREQNP
jgi:hypothetical protein